jgi:ABC-type dipeptide/oligopeptide/nickel transport system permease subunit
MAEAVIRAVGERGLALRRFVRRRAALLGAAYLVLLIGGALAAPAIAPYDPLRQDPGAMLSTPSRAHWLGTDDLGRDVLSRLLYGARLSLGASLMAVAIATLAGLPIGLAAGYLGGAADDVLMRVIDALQAFPALILAMAISAALGPGLLNVMIAVGIVYTPRFARLVRGQVLSLREELFVEGARAAGASHLRIIARHVLPNVVAPVTVQVSIGVAFALLAETSLSFLGVGIRPPEPSWGTDVGRGYRFMRLAPWLVFIPGSVILLTTLAFNMVGDGMRDALDPRQAREG